MSNNVRLIPVELGMLQLLYLEFGICVGLWCSLFYRTNKRYPWAL